MAQAACYLERARTAAAMAKASIKMFQGRCAACKVLLCCLESSARAAQSAKQKSALLQHIQDVKGDARLAKVFRDSVDKLVMDVAKSGLETEDREEVVAAMWEVASARQELAVVSKWKMQDYKNMLQY